MNTELSLLEKIKSILDLPVSEKKEKEVEVKASTETTVENATAPATEDAPADSTDEPKMEDLVSAIADLQTRVANLESEVSMEKEASTKMSAIVELIAKQPTGTAPKKSEPAIGFYAQKTSERKTSHDARLAELNKLFQDVKAK